MSSRLAIQLVTTGSSLPSSLNSHLFVLDKLFVFALLTTMRLQLLNKFLTYNTTPTSWHSLVAHLSPRKLLLRLTMTEKHLQVKLTLSPKLTRNGLQLLPLHSTISSTTSHLLLVTLSEQPSKLLRLKVANQSLPRMPLPGEITISTELIFLLLRQMLNKLKT